MKCKDTVDNAPVKDLIGKCIRQPISRTHKDRVVYLIEVILIL